MAETCLLFLCMCCVRSSMLQPKRQSLRFQGTAGLKDHKGNGVEAVSLLSVLYTPDDSGENIPDPSCENLTRKVLQHSNLATCKDSNFSTQISLAGNYISFWITKFAKVQKSALNNNLAISL